VSEVTVWDHEMEILGDHRIVTLDYKWEVAEKEQEKKKKKKKKKKRELGIENKTRVEKRPLSWRKRAREEEWKKFRELLRDEMKEKKERKREQIGQTEIDEAWLEWLRIVTKAADDSIGRQKRQSKEQKRLDWDSKLGELVAGQNRSRKARDRAEGEARKQAHVEYRKNRALKGEEISQIEGESKQEEAE